MYYSTPGYSNPNTMLPLPTFDHQGMNVPSLMKGYENNDGYASWDTAFVRSPSMLDFQSKLLGNNPASSLFHSTDSVVKADAQSIDKDLDDLFKKMDSESQPTYGGLPPVAAPQPFSPSFSPSYLYPPSIKRYVSAPIKEWTMYDWLKLILWILLLLLVIYFIYHWWSNRSKIGNTDDMMYTSPLPNIEFEEVIGDMCGN